jgi:hypothetical protein
LPSKGASTARGGKPCELSGLGRRISARPARRVLASRARHPELVNRPPGTGMDRPDVEADPHYRRYASLPLSPLHAWLGLLQML